MTGKLRKNLANIITFTGIISAAVGFVTALINPDQLAFILICDCYAVFSDWLDGRIAKYLNTKSGFGSFIDKFRDRVFILPNLGIIVWHNRLKLSQKILPSISAIGIAFIGLIFLVEILIIISWFVGLLLLHWGNKKIELCSNRSGEYKTGCEFGIILFWIGLLTIEKYSGFSVINAWTASVVVFFLGVALVLAIISFKGYFERMP